jgi:hypothetical protein
MAAREMTPAGDAQLTAFQQAPDRDKAVALAEVLLARTAADEEFGQALENWWQRAEPIRAKIGNVTNTVSGGTQQGPVLQGRDFSNVNFGVSLPSPPPPPSREKGAPE